MEKGADQAVSISQAFLVENEFRFSTLSDSLRTGDIGNFSTHENGFEGDLWADIEAV